MKIVIFSVAALFLISAGAVAGGGANWKVDVTNDTNYKCKVLIAVTTGPTNKEMDCRTLSPRERTTYETGAWCPCAITGKVYDPDSKTWKKTRTVNIGLGNEVDDSGQFCSAACWNSSWKLCRKAGTDADSMRDKDFSWCKC